MRLAKPPIIWRGPITITTGGTYTGNWSSSNSTPTITIATTQAVTIVNSRIRGTGGANLVHATGAGAVNVTITNCHVTGGSTYQTSGRFFETVSPGNITITNNTINYTRGIEFTFGSGTITVANNKHFETMGYAPGGSIVALGNFVQFRETRNADVTVEWNQVLNTYNVSFPEDIISVFKSANIDIDNNYLQHNSVHGNFYNTSSQGTITLDNPGGALNILNVNVRDNQMVDTVNGVFLSSGGQNILVDGNTLIQDGFLPPPNQTTQMGNGFGGFAFPGTAASNVVVTNNTIGYVNRDGDRLDVNSTSGTTTYSGNTILPDPITLEMEEEQWDLWAEKVAENGELIGSVWV